ncbi:MAG: ATP synthase F1 subunit gamma [Elusimicrobia bacterium]|nr:ATP synthase F1 subunit gamma [Elusimicrobiota bacterium]
MATLREIKKKIKATQSIQKTTKAMQMISAARFQKAQVQVNSAKPYMANIRNMIYGIYKKSDKQVIEHPFLKNVLQTPDAAKKGLLIITSEKGLCGSYNTNIMKKSMEYIHTENISALDIAVIGKKGRDYLKRNRIPINHEYFSIYRPTGKDTASSIIGGISVQSAIISDEIINLFLNKNLTEFSIIYTEYQSLFSQPVTIKQILPIKEPEKDILKGNPADFGFDYIYEPAKNIIMDRLLNRYIKSEFFRIIAEAYLSEIVSRRNAMENASKNASDLIDDISLHLNKLRQQQITTGLIEVVNSSEARTQ